MKSEKILVVFLLFSCGLFAQNARFDHFDTHKGLSQNNVNSLITDSTGYIWIGTLEGLTRFDGAEFKIFKPFPKDKNTLKGNNISKLSACPNGNLWIVTSNGGMNLYNAASEKFSFLPDSLFGQARVSQITSMTSPSDSFLWFTDRNGLFCFKQDSRLLTKITAPFPGGYLTSLDPRTLLYWGDSGVFIMTDSQHGKPFFRLIFKNPVKTLSEKFNNSSLVICSDSVYLFNLMTGRSRVINTNGPLADALKDETILSVAGRGNEIWFGLNDGLIQVRFDRETENIFRYTYDPYNNYSFHGKDANSLVFDNAGNLWIGTSKYGFSLYCREKNLFEHHQISALSKTDQEIDPVRAICKTSDGSTWIGFDRLGLVRNFPDGRQVLLDAIHFPNEQKKPIEHIRSLFEDSRKNLWIGSSNGLCIYNPSRNRIESVALEFGWNWPGVCYFINEFDTGELTITGSLGVGKVNLSDMSMQILRLEEHGFHVDGSIRCIVRDKSNNLWIITDNHGLYKVPEKSVRTIHFTREQNGLTDDKLYTLEIVGDTLWIASNTGLMAFDLKKEKVVGSYFESDGLTNNLVYSIISTRSNLWLSTNRGISCFSLTDKHVENYLPDDLFMDDAYYRDKDGFIYFGGYNGYISFNPSMFFDVQVTPKPILTELFFNNHKVEVGEEINGKIVLPVSIPKTEKLLLNYGSNSFSIAFDAFPFTYPDRVIFRYRLSGLNQNWLLAVKNENRAVFTNLEPGDYTFEVEASRNGIHWSTPVSLGINIIPPFWKRIWFKIIVLTIMVVLSVVLFQLRIYTIKRRNRELKQKVDEQTRSIEEQKNKIIAQKDKMVDLSNRLHEADQAKLKFYTNISHEFRTPLTIIMGNIDTLKEKGIMHSSLMNIQRSTARLFRLVNQFIDLRKYDQGELKLEVTQFDIISFTKEIVDSFRDISERRNISLHMEDNSDVVFVWLDKDKTDKILYNLIANAIKYTDAGGFVWIRFLKKDDGLEFIITDTGRGIPENEQSLIFKGFFRGKATSVTSDGHGIGLALVKALVDIQKATIGFESKTGEGTTFRILFKWGNEHFAKKDILEDEAVSAKYIVEPQFAPEIEVSNPAGDEILIVEDNPELLDYLSSLLGKYYKIQKAQNGKEALGKLASSIPDLIITDIMMPVMDGIEFCKTLQEKIDTRFIPVIILSAKSDVDSKIEGFRINVDDYVEKPFHPGLLLAKVSNILRKYYEIKQNLEKYLVVQENRNNISKTGKAFLERTMVILEQNLSNPKFSVETLSHELCMSRVTFYRKMKEITGEGPGEFVRKYRLKKSSIHASRN